jgi:thermitase
MHMRLELRAAAMAALAVGALLLSAFPAHGAPDDAGRPTGTTSEGRHDPHHVLVAFDRDVSRAARAEAHRGEGASVVNTFEWMDLDVVRIPESSDPIAVSERYERNPVVAYAHPNWEVALLSTPNDTLFSDEWGLHNTGQTVTGSFVKGADDADIDAPEGWEAAFGTGNFPSSGGTRVGILDTGIDLAHADLLGKTKACASALTGVGVVVTGSCSDDNLHGTHVAGTVAAITDNGVGVAGVAPNAELAVFKALNSAGTGFYADVVAGIHWLHTTGDARIVSMSIGGPQDDALDAELSEAWNAGTLLIAAAGNDGDSTPNWPAYHPDVVSVAATDAADKRASFSNCNADVEVAAPGKDVWSTVPGNTYASLSGTSMATPHASGVAAMIMWSQGLDAAKTRAVLSNTADDLGTTGWDSCFGHGRVNLAAAVSGGSTSPPQEPDPGAIGGTVSDAATDKGIAGASVDCQAAGSATTATDGSYLIEEVPVGTYTCTASATGYRSKNQSVEVQSNQTTTASFALRASRR